ncbi:hypothetical protein, partial [Flavonifractor plautii]|uniref:hypothetical protein n=1 Tax=Flavonifractor plautii TaxID=292800 RepID=UPI001899DBA4
MKLLYLSSIVQDILKRKIVQILKVQKLTYGHAKCKSDSMEGTYSGVECLAIYQIVKSGLANSELHPKSWTRKSTKGVQKSMGKELFSEEL